MPLDNQQYSRRSVLRVTGLSLSGLAGGFGTTVTLPEDATSSSDGSGGSHSRSESSVTRERNPDQPISVKNDRFAVNVDRSDWNRDEPASSNGESVPYDVVENAVADFNRAIEAGHLKFERQGEQRVLVPTVTPEKMVEDTNAV